MRATAFGPSQPRGKGLPSDRKPFTTAYRQDSLTGATRIESVPHRPKMLDRTGCPQIGEPVTAARHDDLPGGSIECRSKYFLETVPGVAPYRFDLGVGHRQVVGDLKGVVGRSVVDDYDFESTGQFASDLQESAHVGLECRLDVVSGQQDAQ